MWRVNTEILSTNESETKMICIDDNSHNWLPWRHCWSVGWGSVAGSSSVAPPLRWLTGGWPRRNGRHSSTDPPRPRSSPLTEPDWSNRPYLLNNTGQNGNIWFDWSGESIKIIKLFLCTWCEDAHLRIRGSGRALCLSLSLVVDERNQQETHGRTNHLQTHLLSDWMRN